jgi:MFS family permease
VPARNWNGRAVLVVLTCAVGLGVNFSTVFSACFTVFLKPIAAEFGWSRTQLISGYAVATAALALCSPYVGMLVDRYSARRILLLGIPAFGASIATLAALPQNFPVFLLLCAVIGALGALNFHFVYIAFLSRWFQARFGLAVGFAVAGSGLGLAVLTSYAQALIQSFGWRNAYLLLALTSVVLAFPSTFFFLHDRPIPQARKAGEPLIQDGLTPRQALATRLFWQVVACYFLMACMGNAYIIHLNPLLTDRGVSAARAATMSSVIGISVVVARIGSGFLLDKVDAGRLGAVVFALGTAGGMLLISSGGGIDTVIAVALLGLAVGTEGDLAGFVMRRLFGVRAFGTLNGFLYALILAGLVGGPILMSLSFDRLGSYRPAQYFLLGGAVIAVFLHANITKAIIPKTLRRRGSMA